MSLCGLFDYGDCMCRRPFRAHTAEIAQLEIERLFRGVVYFSREEDDYSTLLADAVARVCAGSGDLRRCFAAYRKMGEAFGGLAASHGWFHWSLGMPLSLMRYALAAPRGDAGFDELMFGFYDSRITAISRDLIFYDRNERRIALIREGIDAYRHGYYRAATVAFMTLFDRIVYEKSDFPCRHKNKELIRRFERLADTADAAYSVFTSSPFRTLVLGRVYADADLCAPPPADGIPNRHVLLHGFRYDGATKKTALNALLMVLILLTLPETRRKTAAERLALSDLP